MRQRVGRQVNLGQLRTIDMRVDLRGRYIGVPQDLLQHAKVRTAREHVSGKGVAQRVGMEAYQPHLAPVALAYDVNTLTRQAPAVLV